MRTDDLINLIAQDTRPPVKTSKSLLLAVIMGAMMSCALFFAVLGVRPDFAEVIEKARFAYKFVLTLSLFSIASSLLNAMIQGKVRLFDGGCYFSFRCCFLEQ